MECYRLTQAVEFNFMYGQILLLKELKNKEGL